MNRPRIVGILSAVIGSTAGFLVLHRWRLAGTITGAAAMPVIYALVTHCSHASLEGLRKWLRCRVHKGKDSAPKGLVATDGSAEPAEPAATRADDAPTPRNARPGGRGLQWLVAALALLAFVASIYSLAQPDAKTTILRERVVETVTVTTERSSLSLAKSDSAHVAAATGLSSGEDASTTTTTLADNSADTTVSTVADPGDTTTTLP